MHEGGGKWVGSNKVVELKKNKDANDDDVMISFYYFSTVPGIGRTSHIVSVI